MMTPASVLRLSFVALGLLVSTGVSGQEVTGKTTDNQFSETSHQDTGNHTSTTTERPFNQNSPATVQSNNQDSTSTTNGPLNQNPTVSRQTDNQDNTSFGTATEGPYSNNQTPDPTTNASCWFGNTRLQHGETALGLPEGCMRLVCCNGEIVKNTMVLEGPSYHPDVDPCTMDDHNDHEGNNTTWSPWRTFHDDYSKCCVLGKEMYDHGHILTNFCVRMVCHNGHWDFEGTIDPTCGHCWVYDDPHFTTFNGTHRDWHGRCNYSLAQTDNSYNPYTAVYASFKKCFKKGGGLPSCIDTATFRESPNSVVEMFAGEDVEITVNGELVMIPDTHDFKGITTSHGNHPLLAVRLDECVIIIGGWSGFVVMQCPHRLDVWVRRSSSGGGVDGLCGRFNNFTNTTKNKTVTLSRVNVTNTTMHPFLWLANNSTKEKCITTDQDLNNSAACKDPLDDFVEPCEKHTRGYAYLNQSCQYDLCKLNQTPLGKRKRNVRRWLKIIKRNAFITEFLDNATREPPAVPFWYQWHRSEGGTDQLD
ncbi:mucin-2-like isoform X1 [Eriocheir sinensis]|uniref:mucin-2-like isoform X1 n=1 Tax=Eriocheir sinensis TaxID=95602 RepID=UPI0021C9BF8D|nr:mucin-2-like isoform X1 [Eriocheir sinensis]